MQFYNDYRDSKSEYEKCQNNIVYFAEKHFLKFPLYPCQKGVLYNYQNNDRFILNSCRQSGKTILSMCFVAWKALFNDGSNLGVVNHVLLMSNQYRQTLLDKLVDIRFKSKTREELVLENGSSIRILSNDLNFDENTNLGRRHQFDFLDLQEFAFFKNPSESLQIAKHLITPKGSLVLSSTKTPYRDDYFHNLYMASKHPNSIWRSQAINWWDIPHWDHKWYDRMVRGLSSNVFKVEFESDF